MKFTPYLMVKAGTFPVGKVIEKNITFSLKFYDDILRQFYLPTLVEWLNYRPGCWGLITSIGEEKTSFWTHWKKRWEDLWKRL